MIQKHFSNIMYESALGKIIDDRNYFLKEAVEKIDFDTIIRLSEIKYINALKDTIVYEASEIFFIDALKSVETQYVKDGDYDFINKATIKFDDYNDAADFLTCCKLCIKSSSDYELIVDNETYIFNFNIDRVDSDYL